MSIYLKSHDIKGDVTTSGYQDCVAMTSFNFRVGNGAYNQVGQSDRLPSTPHFGEIELTKTTDSSSVKLFDLACSGGSKPVVDEVEILFVTSSQDPVTYQKFVLKNVAIRDYTQFADLQSSRPMESFTLVYDMIGMTVIPIDAQHKMVAPKTAGYDLPQACAI